MVGLSILVRFFFKPWLEQKETFLSSFHTTIALAHFKGLRLLGFFHKNEWSTLVFLSANCPIVRLDKGGSILVGFSLLYFAGFGQGCSCKPGELVVWILG